METISELVDRLRKEGGDAGIFFRALSLSDWDYKVYTDHEGWTIKQLLAHFIAAEKGFWELIPSVVDGGKGAPVEFNIDEYNHQSVSKMDYLPPDFLLQEFLLTRRETIRIVQSFTEDDLYKVGRHPFLGSASVRDMIKLIYNHNRLHLRDAWRSIKNLYVR